MGGACRNLPVNFNPLDESTYDGWTLATIRSDDGSSQAYTIPFTFTFFGHNYLGINKTLFINNNGNLSFDNPYFVFTPEGFPLFGVPMIAPFWSDVDTRLANGGYVWMKQFGNVLAVTWDQVGYYEFGVDKKNTFQVLISDRLDPSLGMGNNVCFCYGAMEWATGDIGTGVDGFGGDPATVGVNNGDGTFFQTGRFDKTGDAYDGPEGNSDGVDFLDNKSFCYDTSVMSAPSSGPSSPPSTGPSTSPSGSPRSEERRVGKECSQECRSRWSPYH